MNTTLTPAEQMRKLAKETGGTFVVSKRGVPRTLLEKDGITYSVVFIGGTGKYRLCWPYPSANQAVLTFDQKIGLLAYLSRRDVIGNWDMSWLRGGYSKERNR